MKQEEYFGTGSIENLEKVLSRNRSSKIFLVTGKKSFELSGAKNLLEDKLKKYEVNVFNDFSDNPKIEDIIKGMKLFVENGCDAVIAAGGGSVIDIAKSINILSAQNENPEDIVKGKSEISKRGKYLIAIPTTSGSGSEATHFAVVYIGKKKFSIAHKSILPDTAIIDPQFTFNLNSEITATSGIDAFSQAIESHWSVNSNDESRRYSREAIKIIFENLETAVNNPSEESRVNMSEAANLAGKAINITKTTAPHAVSYSMTTYFGIPHGQAVSITLGEFLKYNYEVSDKDITGNKSVNEIKNSINELIEMAGGKKVDEASRKITELMKKINLCTTLSELKIKPTDLDLILDNVNLERLQNNPRKVTREGLEQILRNIL